MLEDLSVVINYQTYEERIANIQEGFTKYVTSSQEVDLFLKLMEEIIISDLQEESGEMKVYRAIKKMVRRLF